MKRSRGPTSLRRDYQSVVETLFDTIATVEIQARIPTLAQLDMLFEDRDNPATKDRINALMGQSIQHIQANAHALCIQGGGMLTLVLELA